MNQYQAIRITLVITVFGEKSKALQKSVFVIIAKSNTYPPLPTRYTRVAFVVKPLTLPPPPNHGARSLCPQDNFLPYRTFFCVLGLSNASRGWELRFLVL